MDDDAQYFNTDTLEVIFRKAHPNFQLHCMLRQVFAYMLLDTPKSCTITSRWVISSQIEFSTRNCPTESNCWKDERPWAAGFVRVNARELQMVEGLIRSSWIRDSRVIFPYSCTAKFHNDYSSLLIMQYTWLYAIYGKGTAVWSSKCPHITNLACHMLFVLYQCISR